jgi:hypothetical protein
MSFDLVIRTLGVLTCLYTVAYFVTTMSVAALNGVTYNSGPMCGESGCVVIASKQLSGPRYAYATDDAPLWTTVAFLTMD